MTAITVAAQVGELRRLLRDAEQAQTDAAEREATLRAVKSQAQSLIRDIQKKIKDGESTGDPLLDINITVNDSVVKDKFYRFLKQLQTAIAAHPGQMVVDCDNSFWRVRLLVLTDMPTVGWTDYNYHSRRRRGCTIATIPVAQRVNPDAHPRPQLEELDPIDIGVSEDNLLGSWKEKYFNRRLIIGDAEVQSWFERLKPADAFKVWMAAKMIGKSLTIFPALANEIRNRREAAVAQLVDKTSKLKQLQDDFRYWQERPLEALSQSAANRGFTVNPTRHPKIEFTKTADGFQVNLGFGPAISKAFEDLRGLVDNCVVELEMHDNPTLRKAAELIGYQLDGEPVAA